MDCEILTTGDKLWFGADHFHAMSLKVADYSHILGTEKKTNDYYLALHITQLLIVCLKNLFVRCFVMKHCTNSKGTLILGFTLWLTQLIILPVDDFSTKLWCLPLKPEIQV